MSFIYHGDFRDEITEMIVDLSSSNMSENQQGWINNKVSFLIAECFQNILKQPDMEESEGDHKGVFSIRDITDTVFISSLNRIQSSYIEEMSAFIDNINGLNKEEVKQLYLNYLTKEDSSRNQNNLAMIEMARRSGNKLAYYFDTIDNSNSMFYFQLQFNPGKKTSLTHNRINFEITKQTYRMVKRHKIYMVHKGNFSQKTIFPIIEMAEKNLDKYLDLSSKKRSCHVLVELLQNISKHGYSEHGNTDGIFMLSGEKGYFYIQAGNYVENAHIEKLTLLLDFINNNERDDIIEYYKGILRYGKPTEKGGAGVGLIDILRNSHGSLQYRFFPINNIVSFYCIQVRIGLNLK